MKKFEYISVNNSVDPSIYIISICRPEVRNCIHAKAAEELAQAFIDFENNENANVAILYGEGGNFCAGADLKAISSTFNSELNTRSYNKLQNVTDTIENRGPILDSSGPMGPSRLLLSKPVIAAISGYAVAGGLELACWCDLRVADINSTFGVFCRRFGVPLIDGGTSRLVHLLGLSRSLDMILTGRAVNAIEGLQIGLVNRLVIPNENNKLGEQVQSDSSELPPVLDAAIELAKSISVHPQLCMRQDRLSTYQSIGKSPRDALKNEFEYGMPIVRKEGFDGASRFTSGQGRSGVFSHSLTPKKLNYTVMNYFDQSKL